MCYNMLLLSIEASRRIEKEELMKSKGSSEERKRKKKMLLREQVYSGIKNAIISGELEPEEDS